MSSDRRAGSTPAWGISDICKDMKKTADKGSLFCVSFKLEYIVLRQHRVDDQEQFQLFHIFIS